MNSTYAHHYYHSLIIKLAVAALVPHQAPTSSFELYSIFEFTSFQQYQPQSIYFWLILTHLITRAVAEDKLSFNQIALSQAQVASISWEIGVRGCITYLYIHTKSGL